jgi:hypothetical protein
MPGKNRAIYHDEIISGELRQIGCSSTASVTSASAIFYNGNRRSEFAQAEGFTKLGVENVGAIVTRGVLIDVAKFKGVAQLPATYEITVADLKGALQKENVQIRSGDVVLIHTGWSSLWMKDNTKFGATEPGIGLAAAQFLVDAEVVCRRGYLGRRGDAESRCVAVGAGPSALPGAQRHLSPREPHHGRTRA